MVLVVQALVFADGGLSALGLNIINMAFVTVLVAWVVFRLLLRVLPRSRGSIVGASFVAAFLSVPAVAAGVHARVRSSAAPATFSFGTVLAAMVGIHVFIGIGEGVITALTVGAVVAVRPDLVYGAPGCCPRWRSVPPPSPPDPTATHEEDPPWGP